MMRRYSDWLVVGAFLVPPWMALLVGIYWLWLQPVPVEITYQHAHFLAGPAHNLAEAKQYEIADDIVGPGQPLWVYREWCHADRVYGSTASEWVATNASFVWAATQRPIPDPGKGCHARSSGLSAPNSISREYEYLGRWKITTNPLRDDIIEFPPLRLVLRNPRP